MFPVSGKNSIKNRGIFLLSFAIVFHEVIQMKVATFFLAVFLVCIVPILMSLPFLEKGNPQQMLTLPAKQEVTTEPFNEDIVAVYKDGAISMLPVETYITAVVLAEMPASFEMEALKAQAVVARTYTYRKMSHPKHGGAAVCTDSNCCQAYTTVDDYIEKGGKMDSVDRIVQAVSETTGQVMTYKGELIEATYFSCSGGKTEDAAAVWGAEVPYLQSVESPGEENAHHYTETVKLTATQFCEKLGIYPDGAIETWVGKITYTDGGGVSAIEIGDQTISGTQMRKSLNLRSTSFVITAIGDTVTITTKGFGHRVGMSQYGADAMAVSGSSYQEILFHYYQGVQLINLVG